MDRKEEKKEEQKQQSSHTSVRVLSERAQINSIHPDSLQTGRQTDSHPRGSEGCGPIQGTPKERRVRLGRSDCRLSGPSMTP